MLAAAGAAAGAAAEVAVSAGAAGAAAGAGKQLAHFFIFHFYDDPIFHTSLVCHKIIIINW